MGRVCTVLVEPGQQTSIERQMKYILVLMKMDQTIVLLSHTKRPLAVPVPLL